jgi:hypothetical protein
MQLHNNNNKCKIIKQWHIEHCRDSKMGKISSSSISQILELIDFFPHRPPVISGSHTLQHPNKGKHVNENMIPPHHHPNIRQMGMGTQTLGRHHHSPNHMRQNSGNKILKLITIRKNSN